MAEITGVSDCLQKAINNLVASLPSYPLQRPIPSVAQVAMQN